MEQSEKGKGFSSFLESERGKLISKWIQWIFIVGVPALLIIQLTRVGWTEILESLPSQAWFYVLLLLLFCGLPISETLIYKHAFGVRFLTGLPFFFKKRVYNHDFLNYSGEVYLFMWAEKTFGLPKKRVLSTIKDNNIVSAVASTAFAVAVLGILIISGFVVLPSSVSDATWLQVVLGLAVIGVLAALIVRFRHSIFYVGTKSLAFFFGVHFGRLMVVSALQVVQWAIVLPDTGLSVLFTLLSVQIVANRIPMLPVRDLVFLGISVQLTSVLDVSTAAVAGMLLVSSVINRLLNVVILLVVGIHEVRSTKATAALAVNDQTDRDSSKSADRTTNQDLTPESD